MGCAKRGGQVQGVANYQGVQLRWCIETVEEPDIVDMDLGWCQCEK
jgi:hypothetical protein